MPKYLNVGQLKNLIKDLPEDYDVCIVSSETKYHISVVRSIGVLACDYEERDALGLYPGPLESIADETDFCVEVLFPNEKEETK